MSKVEFAKIGEIEPSKITKATLKVTDYDFEYKGNDLNNA